MTEGMSKETQARLFERFYKASSQHDNSNGLGLAIAKQYLNYMTALSQSKVKE